MLIGRSWWLKLWTASYEVIDDDGVEHAATRPVVAICRCDRSSRAPWCDSTHRAVRRVEAR